MKIVCASDIHNKWGKVDWPDGDILVVAGDMTMMGRPEEVGKAAAYLESLPYKHKVVIAGNHDWLFQKYPHLARKFMVQAGVEYLEGTSVEIEGVKFWGGPWQPWFHGWAFNVERGLAIRQFWDQIPANTDVLVTHGPPWGMLDQVCQGPNLGCEELYEAVVRTKPKFHVFGHIHDGYGMTSNLHTTFINASVCNEEYAAVNKPIVIDTEAGHD